MAAFINLEQREGGVEMVPEMVVPSAAASSSQMPRHHLGGPPNMGRAIGLAAFGLLALILCTVTVRHLAAAPSTASMAPPQPAPQLPAPPLADQLDALRSRVAQLQRAIVELQKQRREEDGEGADGGLLVGRQMWSPYERQLARRQMAWQPMKRMVQWQPVKRDNNPPPPFYSAADGVAPDPAKEQVMLTIEQQLSEVLQAGQRLGISADHILAHLRARNGGR